MLLEPYKTKGILALFGPKSETKSRMNPSRFFQATSRQCRGAVADVTSQPQPRSYGAKARFGRRFDESLLVELDLVGFSDATTVAKSGGSVDTSSAAFRCKQNPFAEGCDDGVPVAPPPPPPPAPLAAAE